MKRMSKAGLLILGEDPTLGDQMIHEEMAALATVAAN